MRDNFSRGELIEVLNINADVAAEAIRQLTATSLVARRTENDDESFSVSPSVRDLLRENPRNLATRERVRKQIDEQARSVRHHRSIQRQRGFSPFSEDFISESTPELLSAVLISAIKVLRTPRPNHQQILMALNRLKSIASQYSNLSVTHVTLGRLYLLASDSLSAEQCFRYAAEIDVVSPVARLALINYLLGRSRPDEAISLADSLFEQGWHDPKRSDEFTARRVWTNYLRALTEMERYDDVIAFASRAEGSVAIRETARTSLANVLIYKAAHDNARHPDKALSFLVEAANTLNEKPSSEYVVGFWKTVSRFLLRETTHLLEVCQQIALPEADVRALFASIEPNVVASHDQYTPERQRTDLVPRISALREYALSENPFQSKMWGRFCGEDEDVETKVMRLIADGYEMVSVFKIPASDRFAFVFAENENSERFYIHRMYCSSNDYDRWDRLQIGSQVAARNFLPPRNENGYPVPSEIVLI